MTVTINGTTGIAGTNGSAGTPAVQGEDTNTGIFFPAADTVGVATAGTERLRVDSSGNVGIGTSSPSFAGGSGLEINGGANQGRLAIKNSATGGGSTDGFQIAVGTDSSVYLEQRENTFLAFSTNATERARINASGALLVGTTGAPAAASTYGGFGGESFVVGGANNSTLFYTTGATNAGTPISGARGNDGPIAYWFRNGGAVGSISVTSSATAYNTSSDYRLKENVAPMQNALDAISQLNPVTYTWKADGSAGQGFIAHELQAVVPDCVTGEKDAVDETGNPQYQGVDTSFLVATLVKAIQELTARVAQLEARQ